MDLCLWQTLSDERVLDPLKKSLKFGVNGSVKNVKMFVASEERCWMAVYKVALNITRRQSLECIY